MHLLLTVVAAVCALLALAGAAYFALCVWAAGRFRRQVAEAVLTDFEPAVTILKSLKGLDLHMYAAFRSHCLFDYPEYELLFGASDPDEPALTLVARLQQEFPRRRIRVVHCPQSLGLNGKVSTLAQILPESNIRAHPYQRQRHRGPGGLSAASDVLVRG